MLKINEISDIKRKCIKDLKKLNVSWKRVEVAIRMAMEICEPASASSDQELEVGMTDYEYDDFSHVLEIKYFCALPKNMGALQAFHENTIIIPCAAEE